MRLQRFRDYIKQNPADTEAAALSRELFRIINQKPVLPRRESTER